MKNKPELLAPAGDLERLKVALLYGADAVYFGGPSFGLRANAINFSFEDMKEAAEYAHKLGKRLYVTVNIVLHNKEAKGLVKYLKEIEKTGIDAIIVSDPYVIEVAKQNTDLEIHLSTQQSTINKEAVEFFYSQGVTRIVLGRECIKEEIKEIIDFVPMEIETFIHGAMCAGYSGRCVLSNYLTDRDANRGGCSQICRWDFELLDDKGNKLAGEKDFTLCSKDLSLLKHIPEMMDMGITSFKIEGRMRSTYYIATVVSIYRKIIDEYFSNPNEYKYQDSYEEILRNCANRDSVPQFFDGSYGMECSYYNGRIEVSNQDFLGIVLSYEDGIATVEQRNYFKMGDVVEIFGPKHDIIVYTINKILDEDDNFIEIVRHPKQIVKIEVNTKLEPYDMIRIKKAVDKQTKK
jgi:Collagenase and related proteases